MLFEPSTLHIQSGTIDMLTIASQSDIRSITAIRNLGHVHLCGVLYASWQTKQGVDGQYLICVMYRDFLVLASSVKNDNVYNIVACIGLACLRVEEVDNGRG